MASDYLLEMDDIKGESGDDKHKEWIEVESFSVGATNPGTAAGAGGAGAGKVNYQDFHFVMHMNKASPVLKQYCANGTHIKKSIFIARKQGKEQQEYLKITILDSIVSSYQTGGSNGSNAVPMDQISLNFSKIEVEYKPQKPDGTLGAAVKMGHDLKANKTT